MWPWERFPSFAYGGNYLLSRKVIGPLLLTSQTTPFIPMEDIYLMALCANQVNVSLWHLQK